MKHPPAGSAPAALCGILTLVGTALGAEDPNLPETVTVTVTGRSALPGEIARDEAIRDACRIAVERTAGVFIHGQSRTEEYQLVYDKVLARTTGFVKRYRVLSEARDDDGVYSVKVRAVVMTKAVADTWLAVRALLVQKQMPRMLLLVPEKVDGQAADRNSVQTQVEKALLKDGFPIIDHAQMKENDRRDLLAAQLADDLDRAAAISQRYKADIILVGKSWATGGGTRTVFNRQMHFANAEVELKAVRAANAVLLFSDSASATGSGLDQAAAFRKALDDVGAAIARKLKRRLPEVWTTELSKQVGTDYELQISRIEYLQAVKLKRELLDRATLITHCEIKDFRNNVAYLVVGATMSGENLAEWLSGVESVRLKIVGSTQNSVRAQVITEE